MKIIFELQSGLSYTATHESDEITINQIIDDLIAPSLLALGYQKDDIDSALCGKQVQNVESLC